jgi:hypothetical protein
MIESKLMSDCLTNGLTARVINKYKFFLIKKTKNIQILFPNINFIKYCIIGSKNCH